MSDDLLVPTIPDATELAADDPWQTAVLHAKNINGGVKMTIAATVALGLELLQLKHELGYVHGGSRKGSSSPKANLKPWPELVAEKTGFSYSRCQQFMKTAEAVRERFLGSRKKKDAATKEIIRATPRLWDIGTYMMFGEAVAEHFDATTFKDLMLETGVVKPPEPPKEEEEEEESDAPPYTEAMAAQDTVALPISQLAETMANVEQFVRHLDALPLENQEADEAADIPELTGLLALQSILTQASQHLAAEIKAKRQALRKP